MAESKETPKKRVIDIMNLDKLDKQTQWQIVFSYQEEVDGFTCWREGTPQWVKDLLSRLMERR